MTFPPPGAVKGPPRAATLPFSPRQLRAAEPRSHLPGDVVNGLYTTNAMGLG